jgi:hypothetical protein
MATSFDEHFFGKWGSYALLLMPLTRSMKNTKTKEIKIRPTIREALNEFKPMHMALHRSLTPFQM